MKSARFKVLPDLCKISFVEIKRRWQKFHIILKYDFYEYKIKDILTNLQLE